MATAAVRMTEVEYVEGMLLTADERTALRLARMANALTPPERLELLHYFGYPERLPQGGRTAVLDAVWARILQRVVADLASR